MDCTAEGINTVYDLYGVTNHYGSLNGGHYTANCRNPDGQWYNFNDSLCRKIDQDKEKLGFGSSAYCLFYNRVERQHDEKTTIIRRQSISRPELWPHLQRDNINMWTSTRAAIDYVFDQDDEDDQ